LNATRKHKTSRPKPLVNLIPPKANVPSVYVARPLFPIPNDRREARDSVNGTAANFFSKSMLQKRCIEGKNLPNFL
jgi:hypothetical protein